MKTREKILKSAWRLFSKEGFEAVSVRDITQDAEVNLASVSYHFGSKSGLIQEIVIEALVPMNKQRVRLLKKAGDAVGGVENVQMRALIEAFVRPVVCPEEYGGSSDMMARLVARYLIDRDYDVPLKVIFETCLLEDEEIVRLCQLCSDVGVAFVKTSTGFGSAGASPALVKLMAASVAEGVAVKASGGVRDIRSAREMIAAGATRLGTSSGVAILQGESGCAEY